MATIIKGQVNALDGVTGSSTDADNSRRRLSPIWRDFDFGQAAIDPTYGWFAIDPFRAPPSSSTAAVTPYVATRATTGNVALIAGPSGFGSLLEVDAEGTSGSATSGQGLQLQWTGHGAYLTTGQTLYADIMFRNHDIATGPELFYGFGTIDTTFIASGALSGTNWIGFSVVDDGTGVSFSMKDGTTTATHSSDVATLVDADVTSDGSEWLHLGFRWQCNVSCEFSVNGVVTKSSTGITHDPTGFIVPTFVYQSGGTTDPIARIASMRWGVKY